MCRLVQTTGPHQGSVNVRERSHLMDKVIFAHPLMEEGLDVTAAICRMLSLTQKWALQAQQ